MKLGVGGIFAAAVFVAATACSPACPCGVQHPEEPTDADTARAPCAAAGARMDALHCKEARADYVAWCTYTIGHGIHLRPACVSKVETCKEVDSCR